MRVLGAIKLNRTQRDNASMSSLKTRLPLIGFIVSYFASVFVAMWNNHHARQWNGFGLNVEVRDALDAWGSSDPASYLVLAHQLYSTGNIPENLWWVINLWAPGQSWIYLGGLYIGGEGTFIPFLFLFDSSLWFLAFLTIRSAFREVIGDRVICLALALYVIFSEFQGHILGQLILYSDGSASALLIILVFRLRTYWSQRKFKESAYNGVIIGLCIASVIYLRSQNRYLFHAIALLMCLSFANSTGRIFYTFLKFRNPKMRSTKLRPILLIHARRSQALKVFVSSAFSILVVVFSLGPYLMWKGSTVGDVGWDFGGKYALTSGDALVFPQNWLKEEQLATWQSQGGGGWACRIDPVNCANVHEAETSSLNPWNLYDDEPFSTSEFRQMSIETALTKPVDFSLDRTKFLIRYMLSGTSLVTPTEGPSTLRILQLIIACILVVKLKFNSRLNKSSELMGIWLGIIALIVITLIPPIVINFEVRYLLALRTVVSILYFIGFSMLLLNLLDKFKIGHLKKK